MHTYLKGLVPIGLESYSYMSVDVGTDVFSSMECLNRDNIVFWRAN